MKEFFTQMLLPIWIVAILTILTVFGAIKFGQFIGVVENNPPTCAEKGAK